MQSGDGHWRVEEEQAAGAAATYGPFVGTWLAREVLRKASEKEYREAIAQADAWLVRTPARYPIDHAAVALALGREADVAALLGSQDAAGSWNGEVFDTAVSVLALSRWGGARAKEALGRARRYLIQADIATANTAVQMWQLRKLNAALANPKLNTENDAEEFGKGHEFPTQSFQTSWDVNGTLEKYLGAEIGAWATAYGLGKVVKSGTLPNLTYTCTPLMPANGDSAELPYFSFVEQIRPGAGVVVDRMAVGCVVEGWTITIGSGPGRANSKIIVEFVGSGKYTEPSAITMPAATVEKLLPSASLSLSINGVNYVSNKNIVSLETSWKNNVRMDGGFYPGSGFQTPGDGTSGAIRGRLEFGNRQGMLKFVARFENGSTELTKLKNQSTGTAVIGLSYDANNALDITRQKVSFATAELGETDGIVTIAVDCLPMWDATNGIVSAVAKCGVDGICQ